MGTSSPARRQLWLAAALLVAVSCGYALLAGQTTPDRAVLASSRVTYWIDQPSATLTARLRAAITASGLTPATASSAATADVLLSRTASAGATGITTLPAGQPVALTSSSGTIVGPNPKPDYYLTVRATGNPKLTALGTQLPTQLAGASSNSWSLIALGDIIFGRTVYLQMQREGMLNPFAKYTDTLKAADLTLADLECSLYDAAPVITSEGMTFVSPTQAGAGLATSGIDAVNLANNHSYNGGAAGYLSTIAAMKSLGIGTFGGGANAAAARTPLIITTHGLKIALLGYSSIVGSVQAGDTTPGMNYISMAPWGPFSQADTDAMAADIKAAKQQADLVFVYYHWGTEYTHDANADQRTVAHAAIDAGADLILGTHPHWVQGVEWYQGKLITYSLGNFVFDQEWSTKTKQGTYLSATFDGKNLTSAKLVPYEIQDYNQPGPVDATTGADILNNVFTHSWWPTQ